MQYLFTDVIVKEEFKSVFPAEPEVSPGEEHTERVSDDVMGPALLLQLRDPRIDKGEAGPRFEEHGEMLVILVPGHRDTDGIALHLPVERVVGRHGVEKLSPDELQKNSFRTLVHYLTD